MRLSNSSGPANNPCVLRLLTNVFVLLRDSTNRLIHRNQTAANGIALKRLQSLCGSIPTILQADAASAPWLQISGDVLKSILDFGVFYRCFIGHRWLFGSHLLDELCTPVPVSFDFNSFPVLLDHLIPLVSEERTQLIQCIIALFAWLIPLKIAKVKIK